MKITEEMTDKEIKLLISNYLKDTTDKELLFKLRVAILYTSLAKIEYCKREAYKAQNLANEVFKNE